MPSPVLPERMRVPHLAQRLAYLQHRRVRRQHVERFAWRGRFERFFYGLLAVGDYGAHGEGGVLEAHGHVLGPYAADGEGGGVCFSFGAGVGEHLEIHVPEPGDVAAVGVVVVYGYENVLRVGAREEGAQDLVEADGVLDQEQKSFPLPGLYPLDPSESATELSES